MKTILFLLLLLSCSCASPGTMRVWEERLAQVSTSLGGLAEDLEQAEVSGKGAYTEFGEQIGGLLGRLGDVAADAKAAGEAAGAAAEEGEENAAKITAIAASAAGGLTGLGPMGELLGMGVTAAAAAYIGVNRKRDGNRAKRGEVTGTAPRPPA